MKKIILSLIVCASFIGCEKNETAKPSTATPPNYDTLALGHYNLSWTSDIPASGIGVADLSYKDADNLYLTSNSNYLESFDSLTVQVSEGFLIIPPQRAMNQGWPKDTIEIVGSGSLVGTTYFIISYSVRFPSSGSVDYFDMTGIK